VVYATGLHELRTSILNGGREKCYLHRPIHNEEDIRNRLQAFGTITPEMVRASKLAYYGVHNYNVIKND
jgi:hypothetical protein